MKPHIQGLFGVLTSVLIAGCQSDEPTPPTIISNSLIVEAQPQIRSLPGIQACGAIVKSNIETIYTGRLLEKNGEEALPHTLVVMKPEGLSNSVYYATDIWKPWGAKKPSCEFADVKREGNSITLLNKLRGGNASARYQLNGETATGEFENGGKIWPITMSRYWADGVDELSGFDLDPNAPQF